VSNNGVNTSNNTNNTNNNAKSKPITKRATKKPSEKEESAKVENQSEDTPVRSSLDSGSTTDAAGASAASVGSSEDGSYSGPGTGNYLNRRRYRKDSSGVPQQEFDLAASTTRFEKLKKETVDQLLTKKTDGKEDDIPLDAETVGAAGDDTKLQDQLADLMNKNAHIAPKYDKGKSFFDDISTDRDTREDRRPQMAQMRKVDAETFGAIAESYRSRHGFGGGGGGSGGGGHRGGSNNYRRGGGGGYRGGRGRGRGQAQQQGQRFSQ
jgi:hypothetical protein